MSQIPREFIDLLLAKIDLVDLINTHIPLRKKSGSNYFARCPFHNEKSASFSVSQPKQFFYCFGCGARGNAIDFMMQHDHLNFPESIEALARIAGVEVPHDGNTPHKKDESLPALYDLVIKVAGYYYDQMRESPRAIQYLKQRGITGAIAQQFQLGYAPPGWSHVLDLFGKTDIDKKRLLDTGLIIKKTEGGYYDRFRDRIMFPILDYRGRTIGFGGRILDQGEPKYLNSPETPLFQKGHELYGLHQALKIHRKLDRVMIVEGYMDVIALFQHGVTYAVATLGTATSAHHLQRLFRYTAEIVFCFDGDQAGRQAAWRALEVLLPLMQDNLQVRFLFLPDGEDPDTLIRKEGKEGLEARLQSASSLSDFFFQTLAKQSDMNMIEGRARFASLALTHIKTLPAGLFQNILLTELSKRARVDLSTLTSQIKTTAAPDANVMIPHMTKSTTATKLSPSIRMALILLIQRPSLAKLIEQPLPEATLPGLDFLNRLVKMIHENNYLTTGTLIEAWRAQKEEEWLAALAATEHMVPEAGIEKEFLGTLKQIQVLLHDDEINRYLAKAAQENLTESEKRALSDWIANKKLLMVT